MIVNNNVPNIRVIGEGTLTPFNNIFFASSPNRWRYVPSENHEMVEASEGGFRIRITKSGANFSAQILGASRFDVSHEVTGDRAENFFNKVLDAKRSVTSLDISASQSEAFKAFFDIVITKNPTDWKQQVTIIPHEGITRKFIGYCGGIRAVVGKKGNGEFFGGIYRGIESSAEQQLSPEDAKVLYEAIKHAGKEWLEVESKFHIQSGMIDEIIAASSKNDWGISHRWSSPVDGVKIGAQATLKGCYSDGRNELLFTLTVEADIDPSKNGVTLELERNGHRSKVQLSKRTSEQAEKLLEYIDAVCGINSLEKFRLREGVVV